MSDLIPPTTEAMESNSSPIKRMPAQTFRDLIAWQKAHDFVLRIYKVTAKFPREEQFALTSQLRRAAVSVAANIAEGFSRKTNREKLRFYNIAQCSLEECRYYLILSKDLGYAYDPETPTMAEVASKVLKGLMNSIDN